MAPDPEKPTAAGKGKAVDETKSDKPVANGKKEDGKIIDSAEELSEEDQQLKNELEMLVERLTESDASLYKPALEAMKTSIKTSTSSMTAVPKPLKFLRPHYETLTKLQEDWPEGDDKTSLADVLSVIGMTFSDEERQDTLKYRLLAPSSDIISWGHEYSRHLALEIGEVYGKRIVADEDTKDLVDLALILVPTFLQSNGEADAVDLMSELEIIEQLPNYVDENTYARVCLYMVSMVNLLTYPDNELFLKTAHDIYITYKQYTQAMVLAIRLNDIDLIKADFDKAQDPALKKQLGFLVARQRIMLELPDEIVRDDQELQDSLTNIKLSEHFKSLGKELNILEPKTTEDIYKSHLESSRVAGMTNLDSARHNLAAAFVNGFVNAGFGNDKMMLVEEDKESWVWKTKGDGMMSTVASLGTLLQWDVENALDKIDKYTYAPEPEIMAGAMLAIGITNTGVRLDSEPALALLGDNDKLRNPDTNPLVTTACLMGLGLSYAGSNKEDLLEILLPIITDSSVEMRISAMAALSCGLIFVGSSNPEVSEAIVTTLLDDERRDQLTSKWTRFMALGLGLLFFGRQEEVDVILETLKAVDHPMSKPTAVLAEICAWAGTGAVLKIQELLHICNEHMEEAEEKKGDELTQAYAVLGIALVAMGEDVGQEMVLRHFGHLMHYGEPNIRRAVPLALGLISPSNPQMKIYDTLSRYSHDNDSDVAINAIFAMGLFMVRIAQGLLHMGKGTMSVNPFHTDRQVLSRVSAGGILAVLVAMIDAKSFITSDSHYLLYFLVTAMHPRFLVTLGEDLKPLKVNVRVGQAVDVVGQAGRPKTITGWQTQSTPVVLAYGERAELEDEEYISLNSTLEGLVILKKNPDWEGAK
ncbi:26S proteasome regulatory subunit rpn-1 like protein [Verticillium longisporum]|uniref:26S proteasome regulatory subunit RPN1 n=1 Tax=Verticillium longisporum TaxID=100787 RepID=A0A8I3ALX6_VERLO|nr:26S proteasome regulatory subunit rpn-1 like protein [Verticillium longisporum]